MKFRIANFKYIIYLIILFGFFPAPYISFLYPNYIKLVEIMSILITFFLTILRRKISKNFIYILSFLVWLLFSNILNNNQIGGVILLILKLLCIYLFYDYALNYNKNILFKSNMIYFGILILINFISIINYPFGLYTNLDGYTSNWFLGFKNSHIEYILLYLLFSFIYTFLKKEKLTIRNFLELFLAVFSTIKVNNSTGLIGISLIITFLVLKKYIVKLKVFNAYNYFMTYIISFFSIIIFRIQNLFKILIVDTLHKDLTLTGRIYVWDDVLQYIKRKIFIGYGNKQYIFSKVIVGTHNSILDILYKTGLVGITLYFFIIIKCCYELKKCKSLISDFISFMLFSLFIMMLTEAYSYNLLFVIFSLCINLSNIYINEKESKK